SDGKNGAVARISARPDGHRGRMAGKPLTRAKTGRRSRPANRQGPKCHLFAGGAFCSRVGQAASRKKPVACPRDEFPCPCLRADLKEASQCYRERHDRGATGLTARVDPERVIRVCRRSFKRRKISPWRFVCCR